ncbi:MAG: hypothetical protein GY832_47715 [Chloroflexi bacterium]|nr:hypothetical protein [Chloroflexota bacterium]
MLPSYRIIICGESIFMMCIEAGLAALSETEVDRVASCSPNFVEHVMAKRPDLIVIEKNCGHSDSTLTLLSRGLHIVEIHPNSSQVTLLTGHRYPITDLKDIIRLIERMS